jgi:3',5'-cyclic AMP phosphodiesterase CpdA
VTLIGAGDIAVCGTNVLDSATAQIVGDVLASDPTAIAFTAGDNVYPNGSASWYSACYDPTWGAFKSRTRPVPGNHDYYNNPTGAGYFGYFGANAGPAGRGWYRYDAGAWRVYALTSECVRGSRCYTRQYRWLRADLVNNPHQCALAIWHRPRFSSGAGHGSSTRMAPVFRLLYNHGAEIVVSGHDHEYERFAPSDPTGLPDPTAGLRQWVVGTGGASLYTFGAPLPASEVRDASTRGVLRLDLHAGGYDWQFIPVAGYSFTDSGSGTCH